MSDNLEVQAARIPDRDRLLAELREAGLDAKAVDEVGIEVKVGDDAEADKSRVRDNVGGCGRRVAGYVHLGLHISLGKPAEDGQQQIQDAGDSGEDLGC